MGLEIDKIDKKLAIEETVCEADSLWQDIRTAEVDIYGLMHTGKQFVRMPTDIAETVSNNVAELNLNTPGGRIRLKTDSEYVAIRAGWPWTDTFSVKMTYIARCGFDMYEKKEDGSWEFVGVFRPKVKPGAGFESVVHFETRRMRDLMIHFPLFSEIYEVFIGVQKDAVLTHGSKYAVQKPIVWYGSSIVHGGCASRPGTCYPARCSMALDFDYVNLGFSGSAKGEEAMARYIAGLDMSVFIMDYDYNSNWKVLEETHKRMYEIFRESHPKTPVIFASRCNLSWKPATHGQTLYRRGVISQNFTLARNAGDDRVWFIDGQKVFAPYGGDACTMDGIHPNDLGFYAMAQAYTPVIKSALEVADRG